MKNEEIRKAFDSKDQDLGQVLDWGIPPDEVGRLEGELNAGCILLMVNAAVGLGAAEAILRECNGQFSY